MKACRLMLHVASREPVECLLENASYTERPYIRGGTGTCYNPYAVSASRSSVGRYPGGVCGSNFDFERFSDRALVAWALTHDRINVPVPYDRQQMLANVQEYICKGDASHPMCSLPLPSPQPQRTTPKRPARAITTGRSLPRPKPTSGRWSSTTDHLVVIRGISWPRSIAFFVSVRALKVVHLICAQKKRKQKFGPRSFFLSSTPRTSQRSLARSLLIRGNVPTAKPPPPSPQREGRANALRLSPLLG